MICTYSDIRDYIEAGRNTGWRGYRKLGHALYAVQTRTTWDEEIYGIQQHQTVIFSAMENGSYAIDNGGWFTVTTKKHINKLLESVGNPSRLMQSKGDWYWTGPAYYSGRLFGGCDVFDQGHSPMMLNGFRAYRNEEVAQKNREMQNVYY